ncbi:MAG TPA: NUDIX hydrolase [Anaerolineae bacterium]|nr:NUDIX hydrolase [Anaerolineae bacterium]
MTMDEPHFVLESRKMSDLKPWKTLRSKLLLDHSPWLRVYEDQVALPDGRVIDGYIRLEEPDFVIVVPVQADGLIGLIRSYKHGIGAVDLQPPAGYLESDEDTLIAAKRELLEETGCEAEGWEKLGSYVISGNRGSGWAHLFLAIDCKQVTQPDSGDLEEQEVIWLPIDDVHRLWTEGEFGQVSTAAAIGLALARLKMELP